MSAMKLRLPSSRLVAPSVLLIVLVGVTAFFRLGLVDASDSVTVSHDGFQLTCPGLIAEGSTLTCTLTNTAATEEDWPVVGILHRSADSNRALVRGSPLDVELSAPTPEATIEGGVWWIGSDLVGYSFFDCSGTAAAASGATTTTTSGTTSSCQVVISILDDGDHESEEVFYVSLASDGSRNVGVLYDNRQKVRISDGDAKSSDSSLSGLRIFAGGGGVEEQPLTFSSTVLSYQVTVDYDVTEVTLIPTVAHERATVTVNGVQAESGAESAAVHLASGSTSIAVLVTAEDGTSQTYTVAVSRGSRTENVEVAVGGFTLSCPSQVVEGSTLTCTLTNTDSVAAPWPVVAIIHSSADDNRALITEDSVIASTASSYGVDLEFTESQTPGRENYKYGYGELFSGGSMSLYTVYGYEKFDWSGEAAAGASRTVSIDIKSDDEYEDEDGEVFFVALTASDSTGLSGLVDNKAPIVIVDPPPTAPGAPAITSVVPGVQSLTVEWTAPADSGGREVTSYDARYIETSADEAVEANWTVEQAWTSGGGDLSHTITGTAERSTTCTAERAVNTTCRCGRSTRWWSDTATGTPPTVPGTPTIDELTAAVQSLTVEWGAPADDGGREVTSYDARYVETSADEAVEANWTVEQAWTSGGGDLSHTITGLDGGTQYDVQVRAVNTVGAGAWSDTATGTPPTVPGTPTIDELTAAVQSLTVEWSPPADDGGREVTSYDARYIETSADEAVEANWTVEQAWTSGGGDLSHTITGLDGGTQYDVQVRAVNAVGAGAWSDTATGTPPTVPGTPTIDELTAAVQSLTVEWSPPADDGGREVTSYDARYIETSADEAVEANWTVEQAWTSGGGDLSHTITGLDSGTQYDVQVRAVNTVGAGAWSDTATGTPPTLPGTPTIDELTAAVQSLTVEWSPPADDGGAEVTSYDARYIETSADEAVEANWTVEQAWTSGGGDLRHTITGLDGGTQYDVQVRAVNTVGAGAWSDTATGTPPTLPGTPTIDELTAAVQSLTVEWSPPADDGGAEVTYYDALYIQTSADEAVEAIWNVEQAWASGDGDLRHTITGLDSGTQYDVRVRAVNTVGAGLWSDTSVGTTRPGAPAIDSLAGVVGGFTVGWSAPATDGDAAVASYDLRYIETSADEAVDANWTVETGVWSSGDLTATVTGLELGTQYDVQVRAVSSSGAGPWSTTRTVTTPFSDDATLSGLTLTGVRLMPGFTSGVTSYAGAVGYTVMRTTVAATRSDTNAAVVILDGNGNTRASADTAQVDLSVGENIFRVQVTAQDGVATETYTVTVRRTEQDLSLTPPVSAPVSASASKAIYTVRFQGDWTTTATQDGVPGGAHFSRLIGAVHNADVAFLRSGEAATAGIESMAEIGGTSVLRSEVTSAGPDALGVIRGDTNSIGPTTVKSLMVTLTTDHPLVTLVTMIAPSPDWFVGVSGLSLLDASGNWLSSHEVHLYPWDAGTENGDEFSLSNRATSPRGVITSIRGTGKFSTENIATLTFTLESVNFAPTGAPFITGAPEVDEELTAHTSAIADADGLTSPGYSYQWLRVDSGGQAVNISGAASDTYRVQAADVGKQLKIRVAFTDDDNNMETLTSDATEGVIVTQVSVSFGAAVYQAEEGGQRATVVVVLDKEPHRTLRIPLSASPGGGAVPTDYSAPSQITFGPGETERDAQVSAYDDSVDDDGESITLSFGDLPDGVSAVSPSETLVQIIDNDYVPVTLGWEETAFTAEEPTSPGTLTPVTLRAVAVTATDKRPESDFAFDFTVNTANGTARQPGDYERLSSMATFDRNDFFQRTVNGQFRWVASADFTVNVEHDIVDEPSESFTVRLAFVGSRQPHLTLGDSTATVTTTDDVASLADLRTTVFANSSTVEPGGQLTYDWSVNNSGPAASTGTLLTGTLDASATFVSAQVASPATGQCRQSGRTVTCTLGTLELGDATSGEIVVEVKDDASADIRFTAIAGADQLDRTPADNDESVTTALDAAPRQITNLRATAASAHIDVTWSTPGDNGSDITSYELERKTGTNDFVPVAPQPPPGATSHRDEDVEEGTEYTYRLRAVNDDGGAEWSNEAAATVAVNEAPEFTSSSRSKTSFDYPENGTSALYTYQANDPEGGSITWSLSGDDRGDFNVSETGVLSFADVPDYEFPADADQNNEYLVTVEARDDRSNFARLDVTVNVTNAVGAEEPTITTTSRPSLTFQETRTGTVYTYRANDPQHRVITWSVTGTDADDFTIGSGGELTFASPPDFENPSDANSDNVYEVTVVANDEQGLTDSFDVTVTVTNHAEGVEPTISTRRPPSTYRENGTSAVYTFRASDPQRQVIVWSLEGTDGGDFSITRDSSGRGVLAFSTPPDFENPSDSDRQNDYELTVIATDEDSHTDRLSFTVTVTDVNEGPEISRVGSAPGNVSENYDPSLVLARYSATDPEGGTVSLWRTSGTDGGDFVIDEQGELRFRNTPDYERPADSNRDNAYVFTVQVSDGGVYGSFEETVTVTPVNEAPTITTTGGSATELRQDENQTSRLYTYKATDPERETITWSVGGVDGNFFAIDERGQFSFKEANPPNFEQPGDSGGDNVYDVTIQATDDGFNTASLPVTVTVREVNEGPEVTGRTSFTISENQNLVGATYTATDPEDPGAAITLWGLTGRDAGDFAIDESGQLTFRSVPDYERPADSGRDNVYEVTVRASDGRYYGYLEATVTVTDVNEAPAVTGTDTFTFRENGTATLHTFRATDPEGSDVMWSVSGQDGGHFAIYQGMLTLKRIPNFENPIDDDRGNVYEVTVVARDDAFNSGTLEVTVTVTDVNEGPEVSGLQSLSFTENQATDRVLATYTATDPEDPGGAMTLWGLTGRDAGDFAIDEGGQLTFRSVPDYERPADSGRDNVYEVTVRASDGRYYGYLEVTVTVTDLNEAPTITTTSKTAFTYRENGTAALHAFRATDPERGAITWSLSAPTTTTSPSARPAYSPSPAPRTTRAPPTPEGTTSTR